MSDNEYTALSRELDDAYTRITALEDALRRAEEERDSYREAMLHTFATSMKLVADAAIVAHKEYTPQQIHEWTISNITASEERNREVEVERDKFREALWDMLVQDPHFNVEMGDCFGGCTTFWGESLYTKLASPKRVELDFDSFKEWHDITCFYVEMYNLVKGTEHAKS